ncbi:hypothetical protein E3Q24_03098 [Wallemia mellicola]|nr:hypothetical protein E3Q24_03098 [Wallemia mellicola]
MSYLNILSSYLDKNPTSLSKNDLLLYDERCITIYDKSVWLVMSVRFPKSKYHFLILPRKSSDLPSYPNSLDDLLNFDDDIINKVLDTLDRTLTQVEESIHDMQLRDYGKTWDINKGFHAVPSLNCIHLHVMSNDLISDRLKNKKHYNSFHPGKGFFIHFDDVCKAVENGTKEQLRSSLKAKEVLLKDPLQSHYNGKIYTNIPKLKTHLVEYFNDNVINNH